MRDNTEIVSINHKSHFVISADNEVLDIVEKYLVKQKILSQRLPVQYGFHSSCIDGIEIQYKNYINNKIFSRPNLPYISCMSGKLVNEVDNNFLWDIIREPIKFVESIEYLENYNQNLYIDVGPSGTLGRFVKQNLNDAENRCFTIITPFHQEEKRLNQIKSLLM